MRKLLVFLLFSYSMFLFSTDVSGIQTGTWHLADSPYRVIGDIQIPAGEELIIEPGVLVQFNGGYRITALGMLHAQGTENDTIYFDRYPTYSGWWDQLRLEEETGAGYELSYCYIRGAETGVNSIDAPLHLHHSHLYGNMKGVHLFAIGNPSPPEVLIEHCRIANSVQNGIDIYENGNATIEYCEITGNGTGTQYRGAIQINIQSNGAVCSPLIQDNYIHDNQKQGITCTDMFSAGIINATIIDNEITGNLTGVYFYNCGGTLLDNMINDNFIPGDMNSGAGVMCYGSLSTPDIAGNFISGNYTALYIVNNANPCLGIADSTFPQQQGMNTFIENIDAGGNNNSIYVYNCSNSYTIMAENNTWDSEIYSEIADTITDGEDDPSLPIVDFMPVYQPQEEILSGTFSYTGSEVIQNWTLNLVSVNYSWDTETYPVEYGSFGFDLLPAGYYYLVITGYGEDDLIVSGTYGDYRFPDVLSINEENQYTNLEIEVTDQENTDYYYVPRLIEEGDITLYHLVEGSFYPVAQSLLYQNGDYLAYWGRPQYNDDGWFIEEFMPQDQVYIKNRNLQVGDTWEGLRLWGGDESVIFQYSVVARDTVQVAEQWLEAFTCSAIWGNTFFLEEDYAENIGVSARLNINQQNLLIAASQINTQTMELPDADPSFFPLALNYFSEWQLLINPLNPWNLRFARDAANQIILCWNPPDHSTFCNSYRLYANNQMIEEFDITQRQFPLPVAIEIDTEFFVTGYDGDSETESSNIIIWTVPADHKENNIPSAETSLHQNFPNPFYSSNMRNNITYISFSLAKDANAALHIYNSRGQKVKRLIHEELAAGDHLLCWDGTDNHNRKCASGVYFYKLTTPDKQLTRKLLLIN